MAFPELAHKQLERRVLLKSEAQTALGLSLYLANAFGSASAGIGNFPERERTASTLGRQSAQAIEDARGPRQSRTQLPRHWRLRNPASNGKTKIIYAGRL